MAMISVTVHTKCTVWQTARISIDECELEDMKGIITGAFSGDDPDLCEVLDNCNAEFDYELDSVENMTPEGNDGCSTVWLTTCGEKMLAQNVKDLDDE